MVVVVMQQKKSAFLSLTCPNFHKSKKMTPSNESYYQFTRAAALPLREKKQNCCYCGPPRKAPKFG